MELRESNRKRRPNLSPQSPFPVPIESITGIPTSIAVWKVCTGQYNGDSVVVHDSDDIFKLYYQGFYGKGSLSRSFPDYGRIIRGVPPFIRKRQWDRRCLWDRMKRTSDRKSCNSNDCQEDETMNSVICEEHICDIDDTISTKQREENSHLSVGNATEKSMENDVTSQPVLPSLNETSQQENNVVVVLPDSDDDENYLANIQPELKIEPFSLHETLHLTLEESFFLSYALGCLQVLDLFGNHQSLTNMWQLFCESQNDFIQLYVAYHYFRSKNWVVKPGVKFGGDFLLYKQGPPFYHALYIVKVEVIDEKTKDRVDKPGHQTLTWTRLMGLHRLAETAAKVK